MASVIDLTTEEEALGRWPRRLLHVPTMTSYEWQPGNTYNSIAEPSYNAISYTWGRWRLRSGERPDCPALTIRGVPWDIPRVDPSHFSASQLQAAIRSASNMVVAKFNRYSRPTDFVWIDIACIDQRKGEPGSTAEVGRQAVIFKGATQVFFWLSSLPLRDISLVLRDLDKYAFHVPRWAQPLVNLNMPESVYGPDAQSLAPDEDYLDEVYLDDSEDYLDEDYLDEDYLDEDYLDEDYPAASEISMESWLDLIYDCFRRLLADPWFSSLWTLQEAFLRSDAVILSREGITVKLPEPISGALYDASLANVTVYVLGPLNLKEDTGIDLPTPFDHLKSLVERSGISELLAKNPLVVYIASESRKTTNPVDRIYGIQQIFDIRVGTSSPRYSAIPVSKEELEIQFGEQLLLQYPALSQMHVFIKPAPFGRAWLVSSSSRVPTGMISLLSLDEGYIRRSGELNLSIEKIGTNTWGRFKGSVCAFSSLATTCAALEIAIGHAIIAMDEGSNRFTERVVLSVFLDATQELQPDDKRQMPAIKWLGENGIEVLHLGRAGWTMLGLLLLRRDDPFPHYHRIGICWWDLDYLTWSDVTPAMKSVLMAEGEQWLTKDGLFG